MHTDSDLPDRSNAAGATFRPTLQWMERTRPLACDKTTGAHALWTTAHSNSHGEFWHIIAGLEDLCGNMKNTKCEERSYRISKITQNAWELAGRTGPRLKLTPIAGGGMGSLHPVPHPCAVWSLWPPASTLGPCIPRGIDLFSQYTNLHKGDYTLGGDAPPDLGCVFNYRCIRCHASNIGQVFSVCTICS